jgi:ABC-type multidrug transport system fused ATPase/permease subunit
VNYTTRYRPDLDLVLRRISFKIALGEKVGVVGQTRAGKSLLAFALFRGLEANKSKILVNKCNISHVLLDNLRALITIVP